MPQSPSTPRRRRSSGYSITQSASSNFINSSGRPSHSRKSSMQSSYSPVTPFTLSTIDRNMELDLVNEDNTMAVGAANGLGSLADELAEEEWDEDEELADDEIATAYQTNGINSEDINGVNGHAGNIQSPLGSPTSPTSKRRRNRRKSMRSSMSGFSNDSDIEESEVISAELEAQIAEIERMAKQDFSTTDTSQDIFLRLENELRDLGPQANIENQTTRLSNSLTALTTHISTQTRLLSSLTQPYTSPLSPFPPPDLLEDLIPLLSNLLSLLPQPPSTPLPSISTLTTTTGDLLTSLSLLSDSIHMGRQTTTLASRRLKLARELVETLKDEIRQAEEGARWLAVGGWEEKLKERQAARVCGEVVGGFEEVCEGWRRRLVEGAAGA